MIHILQNNKPIAKVKSLKMAIAYVTGHNMEDAMIKPDSNNIWWLMGYMTLDFAKKVLEQKANLKLIDGGYVDPRSVRR